MKKAFIAFIIILISSITAYCQHPYKQNLGGIAVITFPDTPKIKTVSSDVTEYYTNYNNSIYFALLSPLSPGLKDLIDVNNIDSVYHIFITAAIKSSKGHVIFKNNVKFNDLNGVEFCFTSLAKGKIFYNYSRVVYLNEVLIDYAYVSQDSVKNDDKKITGFFNTFKLTIKKEEVIQSNGQVIAAGLGHLTAYISIITTLLLLGFGGVFIIRKLT